MTSLPFKKKILELLSATGYCMDLNQDQLSSLELNSDLKPFFDWFVQNISRENCITSDELEEFENLQDSGSVLYGPELDAAIQEYHKPSAENLMPVAKSCDETKNYELAHVKEQLCIKEELHKSLKSSISAITQDITELQKECQRVEVKGIDILKDVVAENKKLTNKLQEVITILHNLRESLSELQEYGDEVSADEEFDTYTSEKINSSISSQFSSLPSTSSYKNSDCKYLCQLPLHRYEKIHKRFSSVIDTIVKKGVTNIEKMGDENMDIELELLHIMDRLCNQKRTYITNLAHLEGIKAANEKVEDLCKELESGTWKPTLLELREKLIGCEESIISVDESFDRGVDQVSETCALWAELQTLRPTYDVLSKKIEDFKILKDKLVELGKALSLKKGADEMLCNMMEWEVEQVQMSIQTYLSVHKMLAEWLDAARKRLDVMAVNIQDYADHCSLPVHERSKLVEWLAQILGSDKKSVPEAVIGVSKDDQNRHQILSDLCNQKLQTVMSVEHNMKEFYFKEVHNRQVKNRINPEIVSTIQKTLEEMSNELVEITDRCHSLQINEEILEEEREVNEKIDKLVQSYKKK